MTYMKKIKIFFLILFFFNSNVFAKNNIDFEKWKIDFKQRALANNISEKTFDLVMTDTKFLANVIKYDRYQPEFYEDTKTYISKRSSSKKLNKGIDFYLNNNKKYPIPSAIPCNLKAKRRIIATNVISTKFKHDKQESHSRKLFSFAKGPMAPRRQRERICSIYSRRPTSY